MEPQRRRHRRTHSPTRSGTWPIGISRLKRIGFYGVMGADDAMTASYSAFMRSDAEQKYVRRLVIGDEVRDWNIQEGDYAFHPYDGHKNLVSIDTMPHLYVRLWPFRTELGIA